MGKRKIETLIEQEDAERFADLVTDNAKRQNIPLEPKIERRVAEINRRRIRMTRGGGLLR